MVPIVWTHKKLKYKSFARVKTATTDEVIEKLKSSLNNRLRKI